MTLSAPSYIIPGTYLENLEHIDGIEEVRSVELLFFIFDDDTRELFVKELAAIREFGDRFGFTVHMPDRLESIHERVIDLTRNFVTHYIIHPPDENETEFLLLLEGWIKKYGDVFLLENLIGRSFETLLDKLFPIPVCCDTGHLLVRGERPAHFMKKHFPRVKEVHLHGMEDGWDHKPFEADEEWFKELVPYLREFEGVCNIEVFSEKELKSILNNLKRTGVL